MGIRDELILEKGSIDALSPEELLYRIKGLKSGNETRDRAFISFLYLTAARIQEVVNYILEVGLRGKDGEVIKEREYVGEPIKKEQIFTYGDDTNKVEVMNVRILKRGDKLKRNIPIYINDLERPFYEFLKLYLDTLEDNDYLFNFTARRGRQIMQRIDIFPHLLRHSRLSHLVIYYGFTENFLQQFTGWKDTRQAGIYVHLRTQDLFNKFKMEYKGR